MSKLSSYPSPADVVNQVVHIHRRSGHEIICGVSCGGVRRTADRSANFVDVTLKSLRISSSRPHRGGLCSLPQAGAGLEAGGTDVLEGDVVEYFLAVEGKQRKEKGVGVVVSVESTASFALCKIEPLCQEVPGSNQWIEDEDHPQVSVPIGQVQVLQAWYSQRMVPDRISNPHGEHAESLWLIDSPSPPVEI